MVPAAHYSRLAISRMSSQYCCCVLHVFLAAESAALRQVGPDTERFDWIRV